MTREELINTFRKLHAELADAESIDPQTREAFAKIAADVERLTDPDQPTTKEEAAAGHEGLSGLIREFEAEHPQLSEALGRVASALSNLGI